MTLFSPVPMFSLTTQGDTNTGVAYADGVYYVATGGHPTSPEYQEDEAGTILQQAEPDPGLDFRSLFTVGSKLFARGYNDSDLYVQTSFGEFSEYLHLDGDIDAQQKVVFDSDTQEYVGLNGSRVQEWNTDGKLVKVTDLVDYTPAGTNSIAVFNGKWYTFDGNGNVDKIDPATGVTLESQATSDGDGYSLAIANHHLFLSSGKAGSYQAYELADGNTAPVAQDDHFTVRQDTPITLAASQLLSNDTDAQNDLMTIDKVGKEEHGSAIGLRQLPAHT